MLTLETRAIFARELDAHRRSHHSPATIGFLLASSRERHADYEAHCTAVHDALQAMEPKRRPLNALRLLGGTGYLSGSHEFRALVDELQRAGIERASCIFQHDRTALAAMFADIASKDAA